MTEIADGAGPAEPIEAVSEMLTRPRHTKFEDAAESEQVEVASVAESTQAEGAQAESVEMLIEAGLDVAELSKESQPVNESELHKLPSICLGYSDR